MKRILPLTLALGLLLPVALYSQDKQALRAAELSFNSAERSYRKDEYKDAANSYEIVLESISSRTDSRKHITMKLDANIKLIDIYFNKSVNLKRACELIDEYEELLGVIRHTGVLRGRDLVQYLDQEKEHGKLKSRCGIYRSMDDDKKAFDRKFDEVFDEE